MHGNCKNKGLNDHHEMHGNCKNKGLNDHHEMHGNCKNKGLNDHDFLCSCVQSRLNFMLEFNFYMLITTSDGSQSYV